MALFDLARMTVSSSGPGDITLNTAVTGYLTFDLAGCSTAPTGQLVSYAINDVTASEIGQATYYSSALALRARTPNRSTNGNAVIAMSNAAQVFITIRNEDLFGLNVGTAWSSGSVVYVSSLAQFTQDNAQLSYTSSNGNLNTTSITASSHATVGSSLVVGATITGSSNATIAGSLIVSSALSGLTVAASSNASVGNDLGVTGAGTFKSVSTSSNGSVGGSLVVSSALSSLTVATSSNGSIGKTLNVGSNVTVPSGIVSVGGAHWIGAGLGVTTPDTFYSLSGYANPTSAGGALILRVDALGGPIASFYWGAVTFVGSITTDTVGVFYNTASDARLKDDAQPFDGMSIVTSLKPYNFTWKKTGTRAHGLFAQEAMAVYPEAVTYDAGKDDYSISYPNLVPVLIRALQQADDRITALESRST